MTQYCRYCCYLMTGNGIWCERREKELKEAYTKRTNKCRFFEFCSMDAYDSERTYQPQKRTAAKQFEYYDDLRK